MNLDELGWNSFFEQHFEPFRHEELAPGRVAREDGSTYLVYSGDGELVAGVRGKLRHAALLRSELPSVGDWVAIRPQPQEGRATIDAILPRRSKLSRKVAGSNTEEQVIAANIDTVFLVTSLDMEFSVRRLERYLVLARDSGATPVILLNKADICPDIESYISQVESVAIGVPVHTISAKENTGLEALQNYLLPGKTAALLGSSGVGKSTIINALMGSERQQVREVRASDSHGRHTTSARELIILPTGGMVIDNPGMREIQMWTDEDGLEEAFGDVEQLAGQCRFRDCRHEKEPGCAVRQALEDGMLDGKRYKSYLKLKRELEFLAVRQQQKAFGDRARAEREEKWKKISRLSRQRKKYKGILF
jgi:ribosome biogenesis GTPase